MRLWLRKYGLLLFLFLPFVFFSVDYLRMNALSGTAVTGWVLMTLLFGLGLILVALKLNWYYFAERLLSAIGRQGRLEGLESLAQRLHGVYTESVCFQRGSLLLSDMVVIPGDSEEVQTAKYKAARRYNERRITQDVARAKDDFWGVANLLALKWDHPLPKSYQDRLAAPSSTQ